MKQREVLVLLIFTNSPLFLLCFCKPNGQLLAKTAAFAETALEPSGTTLGRTVLEKGRVWLTWLAACSDKGAFG